LVVCDLDRRQFAMLGAALAATWRTTAEAETGSAMLYSREELTEAASYPALVRFEPGRPELPLVVFVTLPGNHMFFLGENGARRTVQTLKLLRQTAADVAGEISRLMA